MIRILLVEDHASFGQALAGIAEIEGDLVVVGHVERGDLAAPLVESAPADVAIVDLDLPGLSGVDTIGALRAARPGIRCVVLTALTDEVELGRAVEAGAAAVLHKSVPVREVFDVVRTVAAGASRLDPDETSRWLRALAAHRDRGWRARAVQGSLSAREMEVLRLLAGGRRSADIAAVLGISERTSETHIRNVRMKLGASSQLEAVVEALRLGLIQDPDV